MKTEDEILSSRNRIGLLIILCSGLASIFIFQDLFNKAAKPAIIEQEELGYGFCGVITDPTVNYQFSGSAAEGEMLFKANCGACHYPGRDMTGPSLQGSRERWREHSSEENFYLFIQNAQNVIKSGDQYANSLFEEWGRTVMTPQDVTKEEIDAIYEYVEMYSFMKD